MDVTPNTVFEIKELQDARKKVLNQTIAACRLGSRRAADPLTRVANSEMEHEFTQLKATLAQRGVIRPDKHPEPAKA